MSQIYQGLVVLAHHLFQDQAFDKQFDTTFQVTTGLEIFVI